MRSRRTVATALVAATGLLGVQSASAPARTFYVSAVAKAPGKGTKRAPFSSLAAVEAASRAGDRIVVLAAPATSAPLDGGIRLKPRQRLTGAGPSVTAIGADAAAPRVTNSSRTRLDGDAVRLASDSTVANLRIPGAQRGAIYGIDVSRATITGNDVSGHNSSCTRGFHIPPFNVPLLIPGVGVPISNGLHNGWAGIMVDATRATTRLDIRRNVVRDADCGDGIDVRASRTANVRAAIVDNDVRELREGPDFESILAFGLQTRDSSRLVARLTGNRQSGLGNDEDFGTGPTGADSEGIFVNPVGPSSIRVVIEKNTYRHTPGRGGFSANGLEFVSMGSGSRGLVEVRDSTFTGTPGDVLEMLALGTNATLRMRTDQVTARASTGFSGTGFGDTVVIPGNNGDCLIAASGGAGNTVDLIVRRTILTDCANDGITFGSAVANGTGPSKALSLVVSDSTITGNRSGNLRLAAINDVERFDVKVERTDLGDSRGTGSSPANLTVENLGNTARHTIDLGGGALGSAGGNCLDGGNLAALILRYDVVARANWWGTAGGPGPGRTVAVGGTLDAAGPLASAPAGC